MGLPADARRRIETAMGCACRAAQALAGGCIGEVYRVDLEGGARVVAKVGSGRACRLDLEGHMLGYLREHSELPVPEVFLSAPDLLVMAYAEGGSHFSAQAECDAAERLAALHGIRAPRYGFDRDTLIGGLPQPNAWSDSWVEFFREQRLLYMARAALASGRLEPRLMARIETFAAELPRFLQEPPHPSLLHGDVWTTNVLAAGERITAFLDPAVYFGHPEIELAFITLFSTFGDAFFARYHELRPIPDGFFQTRRHVYNLYPLLVHTRLFGGGYAASVADILERLGY